VAVNNTFNTRTVAMLPGPNGVQLYWGTASTFGSGPGVYEETNLGTPVRFPTTLVAGADTAVINPLPTGATSPYPLTILDMNNDGILDNGDRAYFVDDSSGTGAAPGLYRADYSGGLFSIATLIASNFTDVRGLTGVVSGGNAVLYATRATASVGA